MNARAQHRARLCAIAALGVLGCTDNNSSGGTQRAGSRWQGPGYPGGGVAGLAYSIAAGPNALDCGDPTQFTFTQGPPASARSQLICFYDQRNIAPAATVEWIVETSDEDDDLIHVRLTLNPAFVDNTYGENAIGWENRGPKGPGKVAPAPRAMARPDGKAAHTFKDLLGSDHAEFKLTDADGALVLHFKQDYISEAADALSGYASLGVSGGDGRMLGGDPAALFAFSSSLERNLNACGLDTFVFDSPATDGLYTPVAGAEAWDYRVVYDVWVHEAAFGSAGFGKASVDFVHASPSKEGGASSTVVEDDCPPDWRRYCNDPAGCEKTRCGDEPDELCRDGDVPPPPNKQDEPEEPSDAPL